MKKRLIISLICLVLVSGVILLVALELDRRGPQYFSSPDEVRANAFSEYDDLFSQAPERIPDLTTATAVPDFAIDDSEPGKVRVKWKAEESNEDITEFGDRIAADPASQSFTLPNGQVIRLVGIAHSPGLKKLFEKDDPGRWGQQGKITWYDPVSMQPITDPESVGLEQEANIDERQALYLAFQCSDIEARPVRWHSLRVHDERTKALVANSYSRQANDKGIVIYQHRLKIFHNTPLRVLLPVSYGEPEVLQVDLQKTTNAVRFGVDAVKISIVASHDGDQSSRSFSGGGQGSEAESVFGYREANPKNNREQSFSLVSVWPQVQGNTLQYFSEKRKTWSNFHPNSAINAVSHDAKIAELGQQKWRRFPSLTRGVFELKGIPGLLELDNLFLAEIGPVRFDHDHKFRDAIAGPTLLEWGFHNPSIPSSEYPITFDDLTVTPAQLLAEYEKRIGTKLEVDQANHQITGESDSWSVRLKNWWQKTRSRMFP